MSGELSTPSYSHAMRGAYLLTLCSSKATNTVVTMEERNNGFVVRICFSMKLCRPDSLQPTGFKDVARSGSAMLMNFPRKLMSSRGVPHEHGLTVLGDLQRILSLSLDKTPVRHFQELCPGTIPGIEHLRNQRLNKGLAFTLKERQQLGIHGLQPPAFRSQAQQTQLCAHNVHLYTDNLFKYIYLTELQERNERLFFRLLSENIETLMPVVYTPTVGLACQKFGLIYRTNRGLFITINDKGHVYDVIKNWPEPEVRAIVVTDGERILGLGDLGAYGMGIPVGKLALYTALAGIKPHLCLPITLDVGTNNQELLDDPLYVGLRHNRITGSEYDEFVDEFMSAVVKRYGQKTLIQFEDFGNFHAFKLLDKYRGRYCTFNDDIQGTASVVVAGIFASRRITNVNLPDNTFLFFGAGEAALGIANLIVRALVREGLSEPDARGKIWMFDIDGLLAKGRPEGGLEDHKAHYAKDHAPTKDLAAVVKEIRPTMIIGASAAAGAFTPEVLQDMASFNEQPIVFALSNPTSKAECTAEEAIVHTKGRVIFSSGSPFPPVTYEGRTYKTGQGNNAYIFPGIALGVIATEMHHIKEELFLIAAQVVANEVSEDDLGSGLLYPPLSSIREVSIKIATKVAEYAFRRGMSSIYPEPEDKCEFVKSMVYNYNYDSAIPNSWDWPSMNVVDGSTFDIKVPKQQRRMHKPEE